MSRRRCSATRGNGSILNLAMVVGVDQVGDWGRLGQFNQTQVAALMGQKAELTQPDFIISTGDNFYPSKRLSIL